MMKYREKQFVIVTTLFCISLSIAVLVIYIENGRIQTMRGYSAPITEQVATKP